VGLDISFVQAFLFVVVSNDIKIKAHYTKHFFLRRSMIFGLFRDEINWLWNEFHNLTAHLVSSG
jgi:hypothetical protein